MDTISTNKSDVLLVSELFGNGITAETLPVRFKLGKNEYKGIPAVFSPVTRKKFVDSNITETVITGSNGKGVTVRAEIYEYRDFPVVEWQVFFENTSNKASPILSDVHAIDYVFPAKKGVLHHGNGDTRRNDGFEFWDDKIGKTPLTISTIHGVSCQEAYPFMRLYTDRYVASISVGWTGQWEASAVKIGNGIRYTAGQQRLCSKILPGEVFCTPRMTVMLSDSTDVSRSINLWRRWYLKHILPKEFGQNIPPKSCMHVHGVDGPEMTGATTETQIAGIRKYIEKNVKPDIWWFDAGWYKCDKNWPRIGTWEEDKERFPVNGLAPIGEECEKNDIQFLLWFEPERVCAGTWLATEHPDWCLSRKDDNPDKNMLLDFGNKDACDWAIKHVNELIKKWHIHIYRQDFNLQDPMAIWEQNDEKDRIGALENKHIQGYYRFWDALIFNNPGLWVDSCASGGRRNDLETLRRSVPLHYTDVGYGNHPIKQCQHQMLFEWAPYFRAHNMSWDNAEGEYTPQCNHPVCDEFAYQNAMTPSITVMTTIFAQDAEFDLGRKMIPIWRRAAEIELRADYYPATQSTKSNKELYAVEFSDPECGDGFIHVISNTLCEIDTITMKLHVCPDAKYIIEEPVKGEIKTVTGASLASGYTVKLPKRSGYIMFYKKVVE